MALSTSPIQVSNYTIGSSLQPGKLVVLNGQMDAYDINGVQSISNGVSLNGVLAYTLDKTSLITGIGNALVYIPALYGISYTVPTSTRTLKITTRIGWQASALSSGSAALQIYLFDENNNVIDIITDQLAAVFTSKATVGVSIITNPTPGVHTISVGVLDNNSPSTIVIQNSITGYGPGFVLVEFV